MKKLILLCLLVSFSFGASFMTLSYTFVARQLISASKIMANYNALRNSIIDGTKKINVNELWLNGTIALDSSRNLTSGTGTFTGAVAINTANLTIKAGKLSVPSVNITTLINYAPQTTTPSAAVTGDVFFTLAGIMHGYNGVTWNAAW